MESIFGRLFRHISQSAGLVSQNGDEKRVPWGCKMTIGQVECQNGGVMVEVRFHFVLEAEPRSWAPRLGKQRRRQPWLNLPLIVQRVHHLECT